ncbi:MAG: HEAT repeat domain-containing protein [Anaerolineaceae bacterium]|nr:HEAT repeat domain-containing protein [Anaerolineaceae bacterium]
MVTVLSAEPDRAGTIVDVLTRMLHERRAVIPLIQLLHMKGDPYPLVIAARGLSRLGDPQAVPALVKLLLDENNPYVARVAAAEALGKIGGDSAIQALKQARSSPRKSVAKEAVKALDYLESNWKSKHA